MNVTAGCTPEKRSKVGCACTQIKADGLVRAAPRKGEKLLRNALSALGR